MRSFPFIFTDRLFHDYRSLLITIAQGGASAEYYCATNYFQIVFEGSLTYVSWRMNYSQRLKISGSTKNAITMSDF